MSRAETMNRMFSGDSKLVGGNGTSYAVARVTSGTYARNDAPETPGCLTHIKDKPVTA